MICLISKKNTFLILFLTFFLFLAASSEQDELKLHAQSAVLIAEQTGQILYEKNSHEPLAPASLTKLMTLHLVYKAIYAGYFEKDQLIPISKRADFRNQPRGSSLMYVAEGHHVTLYELMLGLALPSGNDAAVAIAEAISGSKEAFIYEMNREAKKLGLAHTYFVDPAGILDGNRTTADDFAKFSQFYITHHPEALTELHTTEWLIYPQPENWGESTMRWPPFYHSNHNIILRQYDDADGLKTGYIDEVGYNLAATAKRNDYRLIAIILGVQAPGSTTGGLYRAEDAKKLFDYGFENFDTVNLFTFLHQNQLNRLWQAKVYGGKNKLVVADLTRTRANLIIAKDNKGAMVVTPHFNNCLAPILKGQVVGTLDVLYNDQHYLYPLVAQQNVERRRGLAYFWGRLSFKKQQKIAKK